MKTRELQAKAAPYPWHGNLVPHPQNGPASYAVSAGVEFAEDSRWVLTYRATGDVSDIVLPHLRAPERSDGLWQQSCFELFARRAGGRYFEWNFAPDGRWATYEFATYRQPISPPPATQPPAIATQTGGTVTCRVAVDVWPVTGLQVLDIGLSAVIERTNGDRDYWALAHGEGRPDFHAPTCFARQVSPPQQS